ncbi:VOC family protein [Actinospica durhamensis]|uniref:VOC family protein n=1 Tax=Actinospica durhamensis TaxID=1508375 RepID=A0A941EXC0_9ACTN|nr:VOC family protein [Actinospica durhamensis]MBR7835669.1 VOC family protein [Actinospica durhamensis]
MIDHISLQVADLGTSAAFYDALLAPLGGRRLMELDAVIGYGTDQPSFWVSQIADPQPGVEHHVAFSAPDRAAVEAFHAAATAAGAESLNAPRLWPEYHENYFAAFVRDPDGHNVEAVCQLPED